MPRKKRVAPPPEKKILDIEECRDLYEKAMLCSEEDDWPGFESKMFSALVETIRLFDKQNKAKANKEDRAESQEFVGDCCYELGKFYLEADETYQLSGPSQESARKAKPHLSRALKFGESEDKVTAAYFKPALLALSEVYATLHEHQLDIELCERNIAKMTERYNALTPLQNDLLVALAQAYCRVNRLDEAEATYGKIVSICKQNFGADSEQTKEAEEDLAEFSADKTALICKCLST